MSPRGILLKFMGRWLVANGLTKVLLWVCIVTMSYRRALTITGFVTLIATYLYVRSFNSWLDAFEVKTLSVPSSAMSTTTWIGFGRCLCC